MPGRELNISFYLLLNPIFNLCNINECKLFLNKYCLNQEYANKIHENIKIQLRWSRNQVECLDTLVKLDNGHIYTDLYVKPTDKQLYLKLVRTPLNNLLRSF